MALTSPPVAKPTHRMHLRNSTVRTVERKIAVQQTNIHVGEDCRDFFQILLKYTRATFYIWPKQQFFFPPTWFDNYHFSLPTFLELLPTQHETMAVMENLTSADWEYYYDYIDPVIVDESKLKYNKCKSLCFFFFLNEFRLKFCISLLVMKITANFLFPFRLNCYNILDHSGCFCGIPLSHFKSNVSQWKLANVSLTCRGKWYLKCLI